MLARQCDRCGEFITEDLTSKLKTFMLQKKYPIIPMKFEETDTRYTRVQADLCGNCTMSYMEWFETGGKETHQNEIPMDSNTSAI